MNRSDSQFLLFIEMHAFPSKYTRTQLQKYWWWYVLLTSTNVTFQQDSKTFAEKHKFVVKGILNDTIHISKNILDVLIVTVKNVFDRF